MASEVTAKPETKKNLHSVSTKASMSGLEISGSSTPIKYEETHSWDNVPEVFVNYLTELLEEFHSLAGYLSSKKHKTHDKVKTDIEFTVDGDTKKGSFTMCAHSWARALKRWNALCEEVSSLITIDLDSKVARFSEGKK